MKGLLENIRSRTRSPPLSRSRRPSLLPSTPMQASDVDAELQAAMAASLSTASNGPFHPVPFAQGGRTFLGDDEAAFAAAIGASLDAHEAAGHNVYHGHSGPPVPPGSNASQDLAFLTDAPLLPPAAATGHSGSNIGSAAASAPPARRRGRGTESLTTSEAHRRTRTDEDEALARRLQEQWLSEDSTGGNGGGGSGGGGSQWPGSTVTRAPVNSLIRAVRNCAGCGLPIRDTTYRRSAGGNYHMGCSPPRGSRLPPCTVCHERLPSQDGRIHFYRHNFFQDVYCPWHHDSSQRCCSCMRLEPTARPGGGGEGPFAELQDGRMLCMPCAQTAVVDSSEGAPAYQEVCRFFEQALSLPVPREMREVPVLVVDSPTLNEQTHRDPSHGGGVEQGMPTTRGLTLSEVATVMHMASGAMHFNASVGRFVVGPPTKVNLGERRAVTAILVLCGLPYASFSSILAHEAMHAWIKLEPSFSSRLPSQPLSQGIWRRQTYVKGMNPSIFPVPTNEQVEEGLCQLIAFLWLEHLVGSGTGDEGAGRARNPGPSNEELRGFFVHQIKTDVSVVYGDGFRAAKAAYDAVGLENLLAHVKRYDNFPSV